MSWALLPTFGEAAFPPSSVSVPRFAEVKVAALGVTVQASLSCWRTGTVKAEGDRAVALTGAPALMGSLPGSQGLPYPFILVRVKKEQKEKRLP